MEYLEGETLGERLRKGGLPLDQVLRVGAEICEGLEKAHRSGVVHRDLKPGNIMLTKSGAKLMDFGLAKAPVAPLGGGSSSQSLATVSQPLTTEGTIVGTIQYMSPEQIEGKEADKRSDIFSLGAVLYEMVTGKRAFEGKTTASTIASILAAEPKPLAAIQPQSPPALDHIIKICLAKDPDERLQSAHDVKSQLQWIAQAGVQSGAGQGSAASPVANRLAVSDLALIIPAAPDASFAHDAMRPHRTSDSSRRGSFGCWRMMGTGRVGATLYRGLQSSSPDTLSKCSSMTCLRRESRYRPHMD